MSNISNYDQRILDRCSRFISAIEGRMLDDQTLTCLFAAYTATKNPKDILEEVDTLIQGLVAETPKNRQQAQRFVRNFDRFLDIVHTRFNDQYLQIYLHGDLLSREAVSTLQDYGAHNMARICQFKPL